MNDSAHYQQWFMYQETPMKKNVPVKLDAILAERLEAFIRAKKVRSIELD